MRMSAYTQNLTSSGPLYSTALQPLHSQQDPAERIPWRALHQQQGLLNAQNPASSLSCNHLIRPLHTV